MKLRRILLLPIAVAGCAITLPASAVPTLYYDAGSGWNVFATGASGSVTGTYTAGGKSAFVTGTSNPSNGSGFVPSLDLSVSGAYAGGTLSFAFFDDPFLATAPQLASWSFGKNNSANYSVTSSFFFSGTNSFLGTQCGSSSTISSNVTVSSSCMVNVASPFAMTSVLTFSNIGGAASLNSGSYISVPEPSTLALLGIGLLGFGLARRRLAA